MPFVGNEYKLQPEIYFLAYGWEKETDKKRYLEELEIKFLMINYISSLINGDVVYASLNLELVNEIIEHIYSDR